jgi:hypothetical protein
MKGEESALSQGVAEEEQRGRQHEVAEAVQKWLAQCPMDLSERVVDALRLMLGIDRCAWRIDPATLPGSAAPTSIEWRD